MKPEEKDTGQQVATTEAPGADHAGTEAPQEAQPVKDRGSLLAIIDELTKEDFTENSAVYLEWGNLSDPIQRLEYKNKIINAAAKLKCKGAALEYFKQVEGTPKLKAEAEQQKAQGSSDKINAFLGEKFGYPILLTGSWLVTEHSVSRQTIDSEGQTKIIDVCAHCIIPVERLEHLEEQREYIKLAYLRGTVWKERIVPRLTISTARTIVELANLGINVTSNNAKNMVAYLSDVLEINVEKLPTRQLTAKMGWHEKNGQTLFIPYDSGITFDNGQQSALAASMEHAGDFEVWNSVIRQLRGGERLEPRLALAASLASVLVEPLGILPFIVDFYGQTGGGKTVTLKLAASVWGNPAVGAYVGNFRDTNTRLELRADALNSLPMILDDSRDVDVSDRDKKTFFQRLVYALCAGKGRGRARKDLSTERERTWKNVVLTSGEAPLTDYCEAGGAMNRVLEVECCEDIYDDPGQINSIVCGNYGFLGRVFVDTIQQMGTDKLKETFAEFQELLQNETEGTGKQITAAAAILTADEIVTKEFFCDNRALTIYDVQPLLVEKQRIADGQRCYEYILECLEADKQHFDSAELVEQWGLSRTAGDDYVYFYPSKFRAMIAREGFSVNAFKTWAKPRGLLKLDANGQNPQRWMNGRNQRFMAILLTDLDANGFPIESDFIPAEKGQPIPFEDRRKEKQEPTGHKRVKIFGFE